MPRFKMGDFSPKEIKLITQLSAGPNGKSPSEQLIDLAKKLNRPLDAVRGKWYRTHNGNKVVVAPKGAPTVNSMVFKAVDYAPSRSWLTPEERLSMQQGLESAIDSELKKSNRAIVFPKRLKEAAKVFLKDKFPKNVFVFYTDKKDKNNVLLTKKA